MKNTRWFLWIVFVLLAVVASAFSDDKKDEVSRVYQLISERTVSGTVNRVSYRRLSVRRDDGAVQVFKIGPSRLELAKNLVQGDRILLTFDRNSFQVIDVNKTDDHGTIKHPVFLSNPPVSQIKFIQTGAE